jgi:aminoglycoside phosphotransferase (APT) family kinase protein
MGDLPGCSAFEIHYRLYDSAEIRGLSGPGAGQEASVRQDIEQEIPGFVVESVEFEGEGDFCRAYAVNGEWIMRFAWNEEGSRSLEREAALLPRLAPAVGLVIPGIVYFGRQRESGLAFVGYPRIEGVELTRELLDGLGPVEREGCARALADFLRGVHGFSVDEARRAGVVECQYPFGRTEEGVTQGSAEEIYHKEGARLMEYPQVDAEVRGYVARLVERAIEAPRKSGLRAGLVHGDLSGEHVLFDEAVGRIAGVIDFSDVVITTPLLDFVYLYRAYGEGFLGDLLEWYVDRGSTGKQEIVLAVRDLHGWYLAMRLLWALDHGYAPGVERGLRELREVMVA